MARREKGAPARPAGDPVRVDLTMRSFTTQFALPEGTDILRSSQPPALPNVYRAVEHALAGPIGTEPLANLCQAVVFRTAPRPPRVVVVVSDTTRPVPYKGKAGILKPLLDALFEAWIDPGDVTLLVATGTHRRLSEDEIWELLGEQAREYGVGAVCHDAYDENALVKVGTTSGGADVLMNREYVEADFRILTGLVEPHLMAGASGGRKSICPGLLNVQGVQDFHSPQVIADERATDLVLEGNPCHEIALQIAKMLPADFILNVTTGAEGKVAGVFAGEMEQAHQAAVEHLRSFAEVPIDHLYDVVVTHSGHVGVNHYQAEKAVAVAGKAVKPGGYLVVVADTTDPDPVGTKSYRRLIALLAELGPEEFLRTIKGDDWEFVHDQWGAQVWAQFLAKVPREHIYYYSPQTAKADYPVLQCVHPPPLPRLADGCSAGESVAGFVSAAVELAMSRAEEETGTTPTVVYLADGPHGIPVLRGGAGH